jgi:hypothetical protein
VHRNDFSMEQNAAAAQYSSVRFIHNTRSHLINAIQSVQSIPQGLKPGFLLGILRHG